MTAYTCKVVYHTVDNCKKVKNIQLFRNVDDATHWSKIQQVRGFVPVSVEENIHVNADMREVINSSGRPYGGWFIQVKE
jgi:hypothetical protein